MPLWAGLGRGGNGMIPESSSPSLDNLFQGKGGSALGLPAVSHRRLAPFPLLGFSQP